MKFDSTFKLFLDALIQDSIQNPDRLKNLNEVWDAEWDELLQGVDTDNPDLKKSSDL